MSVLGYVHTAKCNADFVMGIHTMKYVTDFSAHEYEIWAAEKNTSVLKFRIRNRFGEAGHRLAPLNGANPYLVHPYWNGISN